MKNIFTRVTLILLFASPFAHAYEPNEGNISAVIGPYFFKTSILKKDIIPDPNPQVGLSLIVLGDFNATSSLELGFFIFEKNYFREQNSLYIAEKTKLAHITMGYRRWFNDTFSGSINLFSAYSMGEVTQTHNDFLNLGSNIDTSARDTTEYGFDFSLQTELMKYSNTRIIMDIRYSKSVTAKESESADHYGLIFGLHYMLQEKKSDAILKK